MFFWRYRSNSIGRKRRQKNATFCSRRKGIRVILKRVPWSYSRVSKVGEQREIDNEHKGENLKKDEKMIEIDFFSTGMMQWITTPQTHIECKLMYINSSKTKRKYRDRIMAKTVLLNGIRSSIPLFNVCSSMRMGGGSKRSTVELSWFESQRFRWTCARQDVTRSWMYSLSRGVDSGKDRMMLGQRETRKQFFFKITLPVTYHFSTSSQRK